MDDGVFFFALSFYILLVWTLTSEMNFGEIVGAFLFIFVLVFFAPVCFFVRRREGIDA